MEALIFKDRHASIPMKIRVAIRKNKGVL